MSRPARILIVDDEPMNVEVLEQELDDLGFETRSAFNGREALEQVAADPPDLILLDVIMPELDGIAVCAQLKQDPATRLIPIVIMTALETPEDRIRGIEAGADDYLTKPVDDRELRARINTALSHKRAVDSALDELGSAREHLERLGRHDEDVTVVAAHAESGDDASAVDGVAAALEAAGGHAVSAPGGTRIVVFRDPEPSRHAETALAAALEAAALVEAAETGSSPVALSAESGSALVGSTRTETGEASVWRLSAEGPVVEDVLDLDPMAGAIVLGPELALRVEGQVEIDASSGAAVVTVGEAPNKEAGARSDVRARGLPWPDDYAELLPYIRGAWSVEGDIYLTRALSGKSGARVYAADLTCAGFSGQAILKLDAASDPRWGEEDEAARHERAVASSQEFGEQHLPRIVHTTQHGGQVATLVTIAGRGLEYVLPWSHASFDRQLVAARALGAELMAGWNVSYSLADGLKTPQELLEAWLGYRLDPSEGRIADFLERSAVDPLEPSLIIDGHWYPNPYAFARGEGPADSASPIRAVTGHMHGDLHGFNVLVKGPADELEYYVIDLAFYAPDSYLLYDHAYFELSHLLHVRETADPTRWISILDAIGERGSPNADDLGLIQIVNCVRDEVARWIDTHEGARLSYLEDQYALARVAAGLNFVNKRVDDRVRALALVFAASSLKGYLKFHGDDWPRHGPPFRPPVEGW